MGIENETRCAGCFLEKVSTLGNLLEKCLPCAIQSHTRCSVIEISKCIFGKVCLPREFESFLGSMKQFIIECVFLCVLVIVGFFLWQLKLDEF